MWELVLQSVTSVTGIKALLFTELWRQAKMYTSFLKCQVTMANFNLSIKSNSLLTCFFILLLKCFLLHCGETRQYLLLDCFIVEIFLSRIEGGSPLAFQVYTSKF